MGRAIITTEPIEEGWGGQNSYHAQPSFACTVLKKKNPVFLKTNNKQINKQVKKKKERKSKKLRSSCVEGVQ